MSLKILITSKDIHNLIKTVKCNVETGNENLIQLLLWHWHTTKMTTNKVKTPDDEYGRRFFHI